MQIMNNRLKLTLHLHVCYYPTRLEEPSLLGFSDYPPVLAVTEVVVVVVAAAAAAAVVDFDCDDIHAVHSPITTVPVPQATLHRPADLIFSFVSYFAKTVVVVSMVVLIAVSVV